MTKAVHIEQLEKAVNNKRKKLLVREENEILKIYDQAFKDAYSDLIRTKDFENKSATTAAKTAYVKQLHDQLLEQQKKAKIRLAPETTRLMSDFMNKDFPEARDSDDPKVQQVLKDVEKNANTVNKWAIDQIVKGKIYQDGKGLSTRIWDASKMAGNKVDFAIASMLAQGKGAAEISKTLSQFGRGGHRTWDKNKIREKLGPGYARKYSSGLDYEALRLARTTSNHLAQLTMMNEHKINPYAGAMKWHTNHTGSNTCDLCISRATDDHDGLGPGIYLLNHVPFDHPNGYCHTSLVWIMNGKIISPTEMADDIGKWIRGEDNSGMMDKLYGDIPVHPQWTTKPVNRKIMKDGIIDFFSDGQDVNTVKKKNYVKKSRPILDKYPNHYVDAMNDTKNKIKTFRSRNKDGSYWSPRNKLLQVDINGVIDTSMKTDRARYFTLFHEYGHAIDSELTEQTLSKNKDFIRAMKHDYDKHFDIMAKIYADKNNIDVDRIPKTENNKRALYEKLLMNNDKSSGVQDVVGALSGKNLKWGHSQSYWDRNNREEEAASELWAHIVGSYSDDETYELMKTYFPTATKMQDKLIKDSMKKKGYEY